jgi:predicted ATP-binding protein involved in virulence
MKIKKLIVRNYKLFDDLELDFTDKKGEILDTIVLAGLNGSGKTTVLELIESLMNGTLKKDTFNDLTYIQLEVIITQMAREQVMIDDNMKLACYNIGNDEQVLRFVFEKISPESYLKMFAHFVDIHRKKAKGVFIYASDKVYEAKTSKNITLTSFNTDKTFIQKAISASIQKRVFDNLDTPPRVVFKQQIIELNKIFERLQLNSKLIQVSDKALIFESINGQKIHFESLSSGEKMLYYMGFMLNELNLENTLILVDQPEDALHPTWQQQITDFFRHIGTNNQVILATHSPQIIASVHPESVFVLGVEEGKRKIKAFNMAAEHKNSYGVDVNRILSEIMGTPIRSFEAQQRINTVNNLIKETELNPSPSSLVIVENIIDTLAIDFGKQDMAVMRLRNELRLLKRKVELTK